MISASTLTRVRQIVSSQKSWCYCQVAERIVETIGDSGDRSDWVEVAGKRIRIRSGTQEEVIPCEGLCRCSCCSARDAAA